MTNFIYMFTIMYLLVSNDSCLCQSVTSSDSLKQERYKTLDSLTLDEFIENPPFTLEDALSDWKRDSLTCLGLRSSILFMVIQKRVQFEGQSLAFLVDKLGKPNEVVNSMYIYSEKYGDIIDKVDSEIQGKPLHNISYLIVYYYGQNCNEDFPFPERFDKSLSLNFIIDAATSRILKVRF